KLSFRSVITTDVVAPPAPPTPGSTAPSTPGSSSSAPPPSSQTSAPKPQGRPAPAAGGQPTTTAPSVPSATGSTPPPASGSQAPPASSTPPKTVPKPPPGKCEQNQGNVDPKVAAEIAEAKKTRQSEDQQVLQAAFAALTCDPGKKDPLIGNDDPTKPLVACG